MLLHQEERSTVLPKPKLKVAKTLGVKGEAIVSILLD
jgi:hypothetical protein